MEVGGYGDGGLMVPGGDLPPVFVFPPGFVLWAVTKLSCGPRMESRISTGRRMLRTESGENVERARQTFASDR